MSNGTDQGLTGQQLQQIGTKASAALQAAVDRLDLRKQCLEMAVRATSTVTPTTEILALARGMYDFLIEPAQDVRVTIDPP